MNSLHRDSLEGEAPAEPRRTGRSALHAPALILSVFICGSPLSAAESWLPMRWHDEQAYEFKTATWRAIVSVERGRLVHFGPANRESNFLFAPATKNDPVGWGGHCVWLGPQDTWQPFWPPPAAWEKSAAQDATPAGARLTLLMPDADDGWPRLSRVYELSDGRLVCRIVLASGGTRDAQIMQILQTIPTGDLVVPIVASAEAPLGCLLLPPFAGRRDLEPLITLPDYITRTGDALRVRHSTHLDKIAFPPQELVARYPGHVLRVGRGGSRGREAGAPDRGFYTQVCPGEKSMPVIELEQMSPLYAAGEPAEFSLLAGLSSD